MTWSANEFISTNETPRYQTKSSESAVQTLHLFQSDAGVCVSLWFQMLYGGMLINIFYKYCCKTPRSGNDTAQRWCSANHRHPSILWQVSTRDSTSADMYHPVHGTARLTKSTHYCCQLLALPLNINRQLQRINLENTNIGYIWRTSPIRTDTKLACVVVLDTFRISSAERVPSECG